MFLSTLVHFLKNSRGTYISMRVLINWFYGMSTIVRLFNAKVNLFSINDIISSH